MNTNQSPAKLANRNMKIVVFIYFFIGIIFAIFGSASGNRSIMTGGVVVLLVGFFTFLLPMLLRKK